LLVATKTTAEKAIREQTPSGGLVDLSELAETERSLAAESVRALCLEEAEGMDPRGVRIKGASIVGKLDCSFAALARPLTLLETSFSEAPCFDHCTVPALTLQDCVLPGLEAEGLRVAFDLDLGRTHVEGAVWLTGAQIAGRLHCDGAELDGEDGQAFRGDNIHIGGDAFFREGSGPMERSGSPARRSPVTSSSRARPSMAKEAPRCSSTAPRSAAPSS
jgi:hypothetical protein